MTLDPRFISSSDLESYFVDKDTGYPLAAGILTFYSNTDQTTLKDVYILNDAVPPEFVSIGSIVTLSAVGTPQYLGNNVTIYYFPYEGLPEDNTNITELYYITIQSSGNVQQFTRSYWPPNVNESTSGGLADAKNFIPNGQFLSHNDDPITEVINGVNEIVIAQGGWRVKSIAGSSYDFSTSNFERLTTIVSGIKDYPRYAYNFICSAFGGNDQLRDLSIQWPNVYKFSGGSPDIGDEEYTLFFAGASNDGNTYTFDVRMIYNYGSDSPTSQADFSIGSVQIGPGISYITVLISNYAIPIGTLGTLNDDYIEIALRGPSSRTWSIKVTDFAYLDGNVSPSFFPIQTDDEMLSRGVTGWMPQPNPDGSDLYLPLILTQNGMEFDHSLIGTIVSRLNSTAGDNELYCDGTSYITSEYSENGIPYSRLQKELFDNTINGPIFGTGQNFVNLISESMTPSQMILGTNKNNSPQTIPADGSIPTGFTFNSLYNISTAGYNYRAYSNFNGIVTCIANFTAIPMSPVSAGTSGMTLYEYKNFGLAGYKYTFRITSLNSTALTAGSGNAGLYILFSNDITNYYLWFYINGEIDPAVSGRTGIRCNLMANMDGDDVGNIISSTLYSFQTNYINTVAGSSITSGSYFTFNANNQIYVIWYSVDGVGDQPSVTGATYFQVEILSGDTNAQVATKTQIIINSYSFSTPDLRGAFLRGSDPNSTWDIDTSLRFGYFASINPTLFGSFEIDTYLAHNHPGSYWNLNNVEIVSTANTLQAPVFQTATPSSNTPVAVAPEGGSETRPYNMNVYWYIKY